MLIKEQGMRKAIIIGGGIAGLTFCIGLRQIRIEAEIYESAKRWNRLGIWMEPNAMQALDRLGLATQIVGAELDHILLSFFGGSALHLAGGYRPSKVTPKCRKRSSRTHVALSLTTSVSTRDLSPTTPRGRSRVSGGATVGASVWREKERTASFRSQRCPCSPGA
jgi:2-polyprenyl-6-methoxyphenol hydroxylase-like FAD-dependent oxidoreductase